MRDDYSRAAVSLRLLGDAIRECNEQHRERLSAYIIKLARLVCDNPLVRAAVVELERHEHIDESTFAERASELSNDALGKFKQLLDYVTLSSSMSPLGEQAWRVINNHGSVSVRGKNPASFNDVRKAISSGTLIDFAPEDIASFASKFAMKVRDALKPLVDADPEIDNVLPVLEEFDALNSQAVALVEVENLMKRTSIGRLARRLRERAARWNARIAHGRASEKLVADGIEHDIPFFVETVAAALAEGTVRLFALHRLRVLFEHFDCAELRTRLEEAEKAKLSREKIIQEAMDRFLFHDGYFPVTHSSASRGYMDTLILESAERAGIPPILVELKQVTAFDPSPEAKRGDVVRAIEGARGEVERYRGQVSTRPQWAGTMPAIVVVHTCIEDLSDLEAPGVVLIDISSVTPSKKQRQRHGLPEGAIKSGRDGSP